MKPINTLIVDDEPIARQILVRYASKIPALYIVGECRNAFEALEKIRDEEIDLLLLDINMPELSGVDLVKTLSQPPCVIFTTAYPEYAVDGFEIEAIDYLLKPFTFERFLKAVNRVQNLLGKAQVPGSMESLFIKADKKLHQVRMKEILFLEAFGDYVKVHLRDRMLLTKDRLSLLENSLPSGKFIRVHRSYIVARGAIEYIEGHHLKIGTQLIPVSQSYREFLLDVLKG
jgi:DNA-binding LytR/AlgR family response regulator